MNTKAKVLKDLLLHDIFRWTWLMTTRESVMKIIQDYDDMVLILSTIAMLMTLKTMYSLLLLLSGESPVVSSVVANRPTTWAAPPGLLVSDSENVISS